MRNDAKPIIPPRQEDPSEGGPPVRERPSAPSQPTGGRLRDRSLERAARRGEGTDASTFEVDSGKRTMNVSVLMSALAILAAVLFLIIFFNWPRGPITPQVPDEQPATQAAQ